MASSDLVVGDLFVGEPDAERAFLLAVAIDDPGLPLNIETVIRAVEVACYCNGRSHDQGHEHYDADPGFIHVDKLGRELPRGFTFTVGRNLEPGRQVNPTPRAYSPVSNWLDHNDHIGSFRRHL